jgi:glycosyltransferase involved in cell wall biosynthesis
LRPRLTGILWESVVLSRAARGLDVLFCPSYSVPLWYRGRSVVATHSVNELRAGAHPWWYHYTYGRVYRRSAFRADRVIAPLESTKRDLCDYYGIPLEKVAVIPQGADDTFRPLDDLELIRTTRRKYFGDDRPYVVFVGQLSPRRNIPLLIDAFARLTRLRDLPHRLLLFGRNHYNLPIREQAEQLGISHRVVQTDGRVANHGEVAAVYGAADLTVYASLYEGFSITLVEATSCGLPVVLADSPPMREIAGGAAHVVEQPTADKLAEAMARVLDDTDLRRVMRVRGLERAQVFRWEDTARRTLDVIREVGEEAPAQRLAALAEA